MPVSGDCDVRGNLSALTACGDLQQHRSKHEFRSRQDDENKQQQLENQWVMTAFIRGLMKGTVKICCIHLIWVMYECKACDFHDGYYIEGINKCGILCMLLYEQKWSCTLRFTIISFLLTLFGCTQAHVNHHWHHHGNGARIWIQTVHRLNCQTTEKSQMWINPITVPNKSSSFSNIHSLGSDVLQPISEAYGSWWRSVHLN